MVAYYTHRPLKRMERRCKACKAITVHVVNRDALQVCSGCGVVCMKRSIDTAGEWRNFADEPEEDHSRVGAPLIAGLPVQLQMTTFVNVDGCTRRYDRADHVYKQYHDERKQLGIYARTFDLKTQVMFDLFALYRETTARISCMGTLHAAIVHHTAMVQRQPLSVTKCAELTQSERKHVVDCLKRLDMLTRGEVDNKAVVDVHFFHTPRRNREGYYVFESLFYPEHHCQCNMLAEAIVKDFHLKVKPQLLWGIIGLYLRKNARSLNRPEVVAAAAVYCASRVREDLTIPLEDIATSVGIASTTITSMARKFPDLRNRVARKRMGAQ